MTDPEELAKRLDAARDGLRLTHGPVNKQAASDAAACLYQGTVLIRTQAARIAELENGINGLNETGLKVIDERDDLRAQLAELRQDTDRTINALRAQLAAERRDADTTIDRQAEEFAKVRGMLDARDATQPQPAADLVEEAAGHLARILDGSYDGWWTYMKSSPDHPLYIKAINRARAVLTAIAPLIQAQQRERDVRVCRVLSDRELQRGNMQHAEVLFECAAAIRNTSETERLSNREDHPTELRRSMSPDRLDDARHCTLEILRCYFHPHTDERVEWWRHDYGGEPNAEEALRLIRKELLG